jgi:UPF0716 protein FxsA
MHPLKAVAIGLLAWPAAEIVAFFCVAAAVGFFNAIVLLVLMSVAGLLVLRHFSSGPQHIHTAGGVFVASASNGSIGPWLGGALLFIPGFLAGLAGVMVLFPPTRWLLLAGFRHLFASRPRPVADPDVIDLAPDEWRSLPGKKLPPSGHATQK